MKPVTVIAALIVVVLIGLGIVFWQLGVFDSAPPEDQDPIAGLITPIDTAGIEPTDMTGMPITPTDLMYPSAVEPMETSYTVKSGDSLWEISKRVYGDGSKWKLIYDANTDKIPNKDKLKVGTVLNIPSEGGSHTPGGTEVTGPATDTMGRAGQYYNVQKGDSLWKIAKKFYNDGTKTDLIFNANRDKMATKDTTLKIGWRLFIPQAGGTGSVPPAPSGGTGTVPGDNVPMGSGD